MTNDTFTQLNKSIKKLATEQSFENAGNIINEVVSLLGVSVDHSDWSLFTDSNGKIASNAGWFNMADGYADRRATYTVNIDASKNLDLKVFWMNKMDKSKLSWAVALTPNYEDYGMDLGDNVGIDFFIQNDCSSVVVVLSKNHVLRTLELKTELSNTQKEIFSQWSQNFDFSNKAQVHQVLWNSFDFEPVNKQFFKGISGFFTESVQYLSETKEIFSNKEAAFYTNRLIGRMVFVWFLNKKGIISKDQEYFDASGASATEYYKNKLSSLFFNVLNTEISEREISKDIETPYLNGGLFEEKEDDKKVSSKSDVFPADYFERFYEFLNHYNFTTDESSSDYQQTAIDPEMLGRIFENLLAEQSEETGESARKAKGAFYTPRDIVDYMCRETLLQYLKSQVQTATEHTQYLERIITAKDHDWRDQQRNYRDDIKNYKEDIIRALDSFTVLDPACGSGAFPMGMLQLLVQTYERIESRFDAKRVKKNVIKNNLFGVDIEPMAIEISRLRAWLSIIVDEDNDSKNVKPLPNLDFKFITANSLISLDDSNVGLFDNHDLKEKIQSIREEYFETGNKRTKAKLQKDFYTLTGGGQATLEATKREQQLLSYDPFILNKVSEFFDPMFMFSLEKFDAVIGNPPYVRQEKFKEIKPMLKKQYGKFFNGRADLFTFFIKLASNLLKEEGVFSYIVSNKFFIRGYGESTRMLLTEEMPLKKIINFGELPVFQASVDSAILIATKTKPSEKSFLSFAQAKSKSDISNIQKFFEEKKVDINLSVLGKDFWSLEDGEKLEVLNKIKQQVNTLESYYEEGIFAGIKSGLDSAFVISKEIRNDLIKQDPRSIELIKPWLRGRDVKRWRVGYKNLYVIYIPQNNINIDDFPAIKNHLLSFKTKLEKRATKQKWFEMQQPQQRFTKLFDSQKIIYSEISKEMRACLDRENSYGTMKMFFIPYDPIILGILNSSLFDWYARMTFATLGDPWNGGRISFNTMYMNKVPIPNVDNQAGLAIKEAVEKILENSNNPDIINKIEKDINEMVMDIYDLTEGEKQVIRNS